MLSVNAWPNRDEKKAAISGGLKKVHCLSGFLILPCSEVNAGRLLTGVPAEVVRDILGGVQVSVEIAGVGGELRARARVYGAGPSAGVQGQVRGRCRHR